jgi:hypothetical protein
MAILNRSSKGLDGVAVESFARIDECECGENVEKREEKKDA